MRITTVFIICFYIYACEEKMQEKGVGLFEFNKPEAGNFEQYEYPGFHLGEGLCVRKYLDYNPELKDPVWIIKIIDCYDSLSIDTVTPIENIVKYKQGGLCFYHNCSIKPEESFTIFMNAPKSFIYLEEYLALNISASKYNDSTMLYKYSGPPAYMGIFSKKDKHDSIFLKKDGKSREELFSIAKPLEIKDENLSDNCNSKFCSTKDFLNPLYQFNCSYGIESKDFVCYFRLARPNANIGGKYIPKCLSKLEELSKKYGIVLMHSGAFPAGDCDLGNWRYLKIDSLSKEHYVKLKDLVKHPDSAISSGL